MGPVWALGTLCRSVKYTYMYFHMIKTMRNLIPVLFPVTESSAAFCRKVIKADNLVVKYGNFIAANV